MALAIKSFPSSFSRCSAEALLAQTIVVLVTGETPAGCCCRPSCRDESHVAPPEPPPYVATAFEAEGRVEDDGHRCPNCATRETSCREDPCSAREAREMKVAKRGKIGRFRV
jgi:hypothetical protein